MSALASVLSGKKPKTVNLGSKGSFHITKPGALRAKAQSAGQSTKAFAKAHSSGTSTTAKQSRAALGLMALNKG